MGPDWFTVIAQIINFLILVVLLQRFLYGPIVRAMDRREAEIAARLDAAARTSVEAEQEKKRFETMAQEFEDAREEMRAHAREEADALRTELLEKVREEVERIRTQWHESLHGERDSFLRSLRSHVCEEACTVARRAVTELADSSLEEQMAVCLERHIRNLDAGKHEDITRHFRASQSDIIVRSAVELSEVGRSALVRAVNGLTDAAELRFEVEPSLICGVEILAGGRSLAWNLENYLYDLEEKLAEAMGKSPSIPLR